MLFRIGLAICVSLLTCEAQETTAALGIFEAQNDVGDVLHPGSAEYDSAAKKYTVSGSGENMWFSKDEFHFVWKKVSTEDLTLTANISILGSAAEGHRKAVLMVRQSLETDAAYVDAALHGDGLTSLQFRENKGDTTREVESNVAGPAKLRIEKHGDLFYLWVAGENQTLQFAGGSARVEMRPPFYVGIGVCAHKKDAVEKVEFSDVSLNTDVTHAKASYSTIETVLKSGDARVGYVSTQHLSNPGWSSDGRSLTFDQDGQQQQKPFVPLRTAAPVGDAIAVQAEDRAEYFASDHEGLSQIMRKGQDGSKPELITSDNLNNVSPRLSPDGKFLVFLSYSNESKTNLQLRMMSLADRTIKTLAGFVGNTDSLGTEPWSPDGRRVAFVSYQVLQ